MNIPNVTFPKSPISDETYKQMVAWYANKDSWYDMIDRMERTKIMSDQQISDMRKQLDDNVTKIGALIREFKDLHGG